MQNDNTGIAGPYNDEYASSYNNIWIHSDAWAPEARNHVKTISELLTPDTNWLDAGCGTGYFLSQFPGVNRAGFDLSQAMLKQAGKANPDIQFLRQMNLLDEASEWNGMWKLVTCTGQPFSYLATVNEAEKVATNLANWTSKDGKCVVTGVDINDFTYNELPAYYSEADIQEDIPFIPAVIWSLKEAGEVTHTNMIAPGIDQWVRWFSKFFHKIEVNCWPHDPPFLRVPRRIVICSEKRDANDKRPATIVLHPLASGKGHSAIYPSLSALSNKQLIFALMQRFKSGELFRAAKRKIAHKLKK